MSSAATLTVPGYQVIQFLGNGAGSTIWEVRDRQDGKTYALKRVVKHEAADYRHLEQAENEYEIGHQLDHPVIRHIYKAGTEGNSCADGVLHGRYRPDRPPH